MKIVRVVYKLFESDFTSLKGNSDSHEIDREICLEFDSGRKLYFSWCQKPIQFSVGFQEQSFNTNEPERSLDVSNWDIWKPLIGNRIELVYLDNNHQILQLKGVTSSIYLSSQEQGIWEADVLHISSKMPKYAS
jgi:hypothetical protein